ncbi:ribosome biogenesis GTP-binding protein YihA/YsxC [Pseudidiomarina terrestris]|uniref:ribosome biogenesis GTP-binding protein YihA/YsxC n=1 Tax=Pseudidiomarina terrestris TaxID=2820060 RepID=UPI00264AD24A|nr:MULTISPECIES: ribosome biogenesis GTP-binding protein YihA/YsxC [unclassified Pseudidiomarina]MDN7128020.1 YihA family ribosome biogenesis GTP-binding protein [Pseudidiomarina sp. 1APR75-33.1]MDN7135679.1 YihA family ribosome biogenesis GTP-binding protein [Pseudidiomarina sp. 1ASP75-5]MDN7137283.1 YihA family ribosome biogenesis GTP-binding protein [Pseudidiomarina sp. 1ASP75-14]MEA3588576.1 YihA family ribosome biogenesis GTP-binding protein [Pseudidiomarina sp. 1APP75-27a]
MESTTLNFQPTVFITSAPDIRQLPEDTGVEIAFAGRSNAGKSSALNTLTRQRNLARTSKTPGRTQLINVFEVLPGKRLIDLPGYGYAKVPLPVKEKWQLALSEYLQKRESLRGLVLLMDIRHPYRDVDQDLLHWATDCEIPVLVLLTKADKLKPGPRKSTLLKAREAAMVFGGDVTVEMFSSLTKIGLPEAEKKLTEWLTRDTEEDIEQDTEQDAD